MQREFAGSGAVGRYWQARCHGFEVRSARGRRLGVVEALQFERKTRATVALVVRRRRRKPLRLRPESVSVVDPWRRLVVVALPRRKPPTVPVRRLVAGAGARVLLAAGLVAWFYAVSVITLVRAAVWLLAALTIGTRRGGARLRPHLHGVK